ncbi:phosphoesterase [Pseudidiomarina aestuarii]|uniref:Phosphoesterase n=1 Tax=Pseudidiomarina aestuarii TaxID=624146 RepID=A0A7Z7ESL9_9GAMM|nr:HAD-IA family hydrolase [Pseudidiomarina aestuarii]RUO38952.1 phosphoesterase [Pseudidiomarina aestuarii]
MQFFRRWRPVKALSFDLDDTLYDNVPVIQNAERALHNYLVTQHPETSEWSAADWQQRRIAMMCRDSQLAADMTALRIAVLAEGFTECGIAQPQQAAEAAMAEFLRHRNNVSIAPEVHQALAQLSEHYPLYALSNGNVDIEAIGLRDYFTATFQPQRGRRGKPHLDMFHEAQQQESKLAPEQWLHIGDSPSADVLGAKRAGWQSAWYEQGLYRPEQLLVLPTLSFADLKQLTEFLLTPTARR